MKLLRKAIDMAKTLKKKVLKKTARKTKTRKKAARRRRNVYTDARGRTRLLDPDFPTLGAGRKKA